MLFLTLFPVFVHRCTLEIRSFSALSNKTNQSIHAIHHHAVQMLNVRSEAALAHADVSTITRAIHMKVG